MNADSERDEFWRIVADLQAGDPRLSRLARGGEPWRTGRRIGAAARVALLVIGMSIMMIGVGGQHVVVGVAGFLVMLAAVGGPDLLTGHRHPGQGRLPRRAPGRDANKKSGPGRRG